MGQPQSTQGGGGETTQGVTVVGFDPIDVSQWQSDKGVKFCTSCCSAFSASRRKHHCRKCGLIICGSCSESWQGNKDIPVCKACIVKISSANKDVKQEKKDENTTKQDSKAKNAVDNDRKLVSKGEDTTTVNKKESTALSDRNIGGNKGGNTAEAQKDNNERKGIQTSSPSTPTKHSHSAPSPSPTPFNRDTVNQATTTPPDPKDKKPFERPDPTTTPTTPAKASPQPFNRDTVQQTPSTPAKTSPQPFNRDTVQQAPSTPEPKKPFERSDAGTLPPVPANKSPTISRDAASHRTDSTSTSTTTATNVILTPSHTNTTATSASAPAATSPSASISQNQAGEEDSVALQEKIIKLEQESQILSDAIQRMKVLSGIIKDCKIKFQQIKKKDDMINEFAKEDGSDDMIRNLTAQKKSAVELIAQNKKQIEEIDTTGTVRRRLLSSEADCDDGLNLLNKEFVALSAKNDSCMKDISNLQAQLKLSLVKQAGASGWTAKYTGEWTHHIPLSNFIQCDSYMRYTTPKLSDHSISRYLQSLAAFPTIEITQCDIVHNANHLKLFDGAIDTLEKRQDSGLFQADLSKENHKEHRQRVLDRLLSSPRLAKHSCNNGVVIIGGFHGTTVEKANSIFKVGFANLATLDEGWYGKGIYFTSHPEYAVQYCKTEKNPCLIFCYIILANPFPVIWHDASSIEDLRFKGKSNYKNYGCHYVPVVHYSGSDYRPPNPETKNAQTPQYDEVVIFQETHILPHALIHLKCSDM